MALGTVLIADDEPAILKAIRLVLTKAGYDVIEAADGQAALDAMEKPAVFAVVDVLLCDLQMPRLDGMETISRFKTQYPHIPVVIMTGAPDFVLTEVLLKQGVTDYLLKPVNEKKLLDSIRTAVRLHKLRVQQDS
jgi:CheY-like chemotaxis protein